MDRELRIGLRQEWSEVQRVNEQTLQFLRTCGLPEDTVDTLTMVSCELVENAIKYSSRGGNDEECIDLLLTVDEPLLTVHVTNPIGEGSHHHLRQLDRTLQWVRGFQDPFQAYMERVREISRELMSSNRSGLGIVRIAYEARATIDFIVGEDDTLSVSAVAEIR